LSKLDWKQNIFLFPNIFTCFGGAKKQQQLLERRTLHPTLVKNN